MNLSAIRHALRHLTKKPCFASFQLIVGLAFFFSGAQKGSAAGPAIPWRPSLLEDFLASSQVVSGTFEKVEITRFERALWFSPQLLPHIRYQCEFRVHETLYGPQAEKHLALVIEGRAGIVDWHWRPYEGSKAIVFVRGSPGNGGSADDNVAEYRRILGFDGRVFDFYDGYVSTVRTIARILELPTVAEQARAVAAGCFSQDRFLQRWCMRTLAGQFPDGVDRSSVSQRYRKDINWIHQYVGDRAAWDVIERVCLEAEPEFGLTMLCDELLRGDRRYEKSQRRYEILWSLIYTVAYGSPDACNARLTSLLSQYLRKFSDRRAESFARLERMIRNEKLSPVARGIALLYIQFYAFDVSGAQLVELLESELRDERVADFAALAIMGILTDDVMHGWEPPKRLLDVVRHPERYPERCRYRLREAEAKVRERSARPQAAGSKP